MEPMKHSRRSTFGLLHLALIFLTCSFAIIPDSVNAHPKPAAPPEPVVTYTPTDAQAGQQIEHGELILEVDDKRAQLHTQHHPHKVLETRMVPGSTDSPAMTEVKDFALAKIDLDVINPGPGEYVHVMEGPYIVNIPPMVPHSFQNLDEEVAELVVIFPTNVWEYDVLNHFPFATPEAEDLAEKARR